MRTRIVFVASLLRSGSTLLQKMLSVSPDVASSAEPWIMLPFWGMRHVDAARSIYFHHTAATAINDFVGNIADGEAAWESAVGNFARPLYEAAAGGSPVFLDKTPRYYLMLPLLRRALPEAPVVLLLRNPLAVLASICETFNRGRFIWYEYWLDWLEGHRCLAAAMREVGPEQIVVRYEDLVQAPAEVLPVLCERIGISYSEDMVSAYRSVQLKGRMGDPTGVYRYASVSSDSVDKWQEFFSSAYRRRIAEKMLSMIDPEDLDALGYPMDSLLRALHATPPRTGIDLRSRIEHLAGTVAHAVDFRYLQARWRARKNGEPYAYGYDRAP
ncbi:MAG: sulfotransferase [Planctomycetales bacterium]|nr:sulfotransferase [Planctomycetales bacterium]